jgi:hypothetical protein
MNKIDLSGKWKLNLDKSCGDPISGLYDDEIYLPDTVSHAKKSPENNERASGYLTDPYKFEGAAWFGKEFRIREEWQGKELFLRLERTRITVLYVDGELCGRCDSLCTPHLYKLPDLPAGTHSIDLWVSNVDYPTKGGHMTSPDTQTNWLGITGAIELIIRPKIRVDDIRVLSATDREKVVFSCCASDDCEAYVTVSGCHTETFELKKGINTLHYLPDKVLPEWDEFSPSVSELRISANGEMQSVSFGIRKITAKGRKLFINGHETFLRGKHDGMIFPMTGYAPTDVESWLKVMQTAKDFGINHYRFHTCCPPEAAFTAADILGIYMQPELPFWGTIEENITDEQRYLIEEGSRILKEFGNHPSFVMMSLGNELWGSKEVLNDILARYKSQDDRHLYTDGSNNFQFWPCVLENSDFLSGVRLSKDRLYRGSYAMCDAPQGFIQTDEPNTVHNYDGVIVPETLGEAAEGGKILIQYGTGVKEVEADSSGMFIPEVPVISHEVGQYETYPDYSSTEKYTGALKAENIALYKEKAEQKGLSAYTDKFFRASGALAVGCYKREIEAALKSEELSGFQLLDIQDFTGQGTALVGVLDAFMEPKGTITAEEWKHFCNSTVVMAEFQRFVFSSAEDVVFGITLFNTDPAFDAKRISYKIEKEGTVELYGHVHIKGDGRVRKLGRVVFNADDAYAPKRYKLTLSVEGTDITNNYEFIVYPDIDIRITDKEIFFAASSVKIVREPGEAEELMRSGEKVIYVPYEENKLPGTYCTDFWCYPMFRSISESMNKPVPIGTMGLLNDTESKLLASFPCSDHTEPQWFNIVMHSHCENLEGTDIVPTVWEIDNPDRSGKFGLLYELPTASGKLTVCTSRLWEIADKPEVKWFAKSLFEYNIKK